MGGLGIDILEVMGCFCLILLFLRLIGVVDFFVLIDWFDWLIIMSIILVGCLVGVIFELIDMLIWLIEVFWRFISQIIFLIIICKTEKIFFLLTSSCLGSYCVNWLIGFIIERGVISCLISSILLLLNYWLLLLLII